MTESKIIDQLIEVLESQRFNGLGYVEISPENMNLLTEDPCPIPLNDSKKESQYRQAKELNSNKVITLPDTSLSSFEIAKKHRPPISTELSDPMGDGARTKPNDFGLIVSLSELKNIATGCKRCELCNTREKVVFHKGNIVGKIMFIGDHPTVEDEVTGLPFSGKIGELLDRIIKAMQLDPNLIYFTNVNKCSPSKNPKPTPDQISKCSPYLRRQIELVKPQIIILLGPVPLKALLNKSGIADNRGKWIEYEGIPCLATFHPSYLLRVPRAKREVWDDMQMVMKKLNVSPKS